jgi:hypothetical protein
MELPDFVSGVSIETDRRPTFLPSSASTETAKPKNLQNFRDPERRTKTDLA